MDRKMIDYLPQYLQEYEELKSIMNTEQTEFQLMWDCVEGVFDNQNVETSNVEGIVRWETILNINPKITDTLEERKFRILVKLNQQLPYTYRFLKQQLTTMCGEKGFNLTLNPNEYHLIVKLALSNLNNYDDISDMLKKFVPANLIVEISLMYNQYSDFRTHTHEQLIVYTHDMLRNTELT